LYFANSQKQPLVPSGHEWWKHAVFYELHPRSSAEALQEQFHPRNYQSAKATALLTTQTIPGASRVDQVSIDQGNLEPFAVYIARIMR
jgi:hypothetical protein